MIFVYFFKIDFTISIIFTFVLKKLIIMDNICKLIFTLVV